MMFLFDIKYAVRILLKKPLFTLMTIVIMALGLTLSLYTYSILNTLLFKPLPIKNYDSLVMINGGFDYTHLHTMTIEVFNLRYLRENSQSFEQIALSTRGGGTALISGHASKSGGRKFNSTFAQWTLFELFDAKPLMGRLLQPDDYLKNAEPVIIISYDVWQNFFAGDENIIGRSIRVDATPTRIIGVMPQGFSFPRYAETWQPITYNQLYPETFGEHGGIYAYGRLKPGVSLQQANAELKAMMQQLESQYGKETSWLFDIAVEPFKQAGMTKEKPLLIAMCIVVLLILLLTCINVANLLLSKVNERLKDIAVRVALGAPQSRLILQMLYESMIICIVAGVIATLLAGFSLETTNDIVSKAFVVVNQKPFWWQFELDSQTLIALACLILLTIFFTGVVPAWHTSNSDFNAVLRDGTRGALSHKSGLATKCLVISEILFSSVVLSIASAILMTTYLANQTDYGVNTEKSLVALIELPRINYGGRDKNPVRARFYDQLKRELENTPAIAKAGIMSDLPGQGGGWARIEAEGKTYPRIEARPKANHEVIIPGTFEALGLSLLEGRYFKPQDMQVITAIQQNADQQLSEPVIISASLAKTLHPNSSAIGKRHRFISQDGQYTGKWRETIGVVSDVIHGSAIDASQMTQNIYHMPASGIGSRMSLAVTYTQTESAAKKAIHDTLMKLDPDVVIYHIRSYKDMLQAPLWLITNISKLFLACGIIAILLAATGIYTVVANSISLRTQEIGVRRALGSTDPGIHHLFRQKSLWHLFWGISIGTAIAAFIMNNLRDTLTIQTAAYYIGFLLIPSLICAIVLLATYIPTQKAIEMEPAEALYYE